jgi:hypothetical protein
MQTAAGIWWASSLQAQVNGNSQMIGANEIRWATFMQNREVVVRQYEQFKATQEQLSREINSPPR